VLVTVANASHSWNYYELIDRTGSVSFWSYAVQCVCITNLINQL
jgi:hypothetical protein